MVFDKIRKRDGRIVDFEPDMIENVVHRAFLAVELGDGEKAGDVADEEVKILQEEFGEENPSVEDAQDMVEVLKRKGYERVAQEYQDCRRKKDELRNLRKLLGIEPKLTVTL